MIGYRSNEIFERRARNREYGSTTRNAPKGMTSREEEIAFNTVLRCYYQPVPGAAGTR